MTAQAHMPLRTGAATDIGLVRKVNQDAYACVLADEFDGRIDGLFVVADGMGGHRGGDVAAHTAVDVFAETVRAAICDGPEPDHAGLTAALRAGFEAANRTVWSAAQADAALRGMGTTLVAALVVPECAYVGNVGDSRAYHITAEDIYQVTSDHSLVQEHVDAGQMSKAEARGSRFRNVVTRGIGVAREVEADIDTVRIATGDSILLCTDGLTGMLSDRRIHETVAGGDDPADVCTALVAAANQRGGHDNTTVLLIRNGNTPPYVPRRSSQADGRPAEVTPTAGQPGAAPRRATSVGTGQPTGVHRMYRFTTFVLLALLLAVSGYLALVLVAKPVRPVVPPPTPTPAVVVPSSYAFPRQVGALGVRPETLWVSPDGSVLYATTSGAMMRISPNGQSLQLKTKAVGSPATKLNGGAACGMDGQGNVYLLAPDQKCVQRFGPGGTRTAMIGSGTLKKPAAMGVTSAGIVYVVDDGKLVVFDGKAP